MHKLICPSWRTQLMKMFKTYPGARTYSLILGWWLAGTNSQGKRLQNTTVHFLDETTVSIHWSMMIDASVANNGLVMIIISVLQHVVLATCVFIALQMVISKAKLQHGLLCNLIKYNIYIYKHYPGRCKQLPASMQKDVVSSERIARSLLWASERGCIHFYSNPSSMCLGLCWVTYVTLIFPRYPHF